MLITLSQLRKQLDRLWWHGSVLLCLWREQQRAVVHRHEVPDHVPELHQSSHEPVQKLQRGIFLGVGERTALQRLRNIRSHELGSQDIGLHPLLGLGPHGVYLQPYLKTYY